MKIYFISSGVTSRRIGSFHFNMCHGVAWRDGIRGSTAPAAGLEIDRRSPLQLEVNAYHLRHVLQQPGANLIVSDRVRHALSRLPRIEFLQVEFKKIVRYPYREDDDSLYRDPEGFLRRDFGARGRAIAEDDEKLQMILEDPGELYFLMDEAPEERQTIGPYYEVLTWRIQDAVPPDSAARSVEALITTPYDTPFPAKVCENLAADTCLWYPILWCNSGIVLSEIAFDLMAQFLDREYFGVGVAEI